MFKTGKTEYNNIALEIRFSKLCHGCIIHFADNDICASLFAFMERRNYYKLLNHSFVSNKYVSRGTFFRPQVYERVGISLVEVHRRLGKSVISVCERAQKMS